MFQIPAHLVVVVFYYYIMLLLYCRVGMFQIPAQYTVTLAVSVMKTFFFSGMLRSLVTCFLNLISLLEYELLVKK